MASQKNSAETILEDLIFRAQEQRTLGSSLAGAADVLLSDLDEQDPRREHRAYLIQELRRIVDRKTRVPELDYSVEEEVLRRLEMARKKMSAGGPNLHVVDSTSACVCGSGRRHLLGNQ